MREVVETCLLIASPTSEFRQSSAHRFRCRAANILRAELRSSTLEAASLSALPARVIAATSTLQPALARKCETLDPIDRPSTVSCSVVVFDDGEVGKGGKPGARSAQIIFR